VSSTSEDFFVGYLPSAPPALGRWLRARVVLLLAAVAALAALLVTAQRPFAVAVFEFGTEREFEGTIELEPYPALVLDRPGLAGGGAGAAGESRWLLVSSGKRGALESVAGLRGRRVRARGTLVYRDDRTLLELAGPPEPLEAGGAGDLGAARTEPVGSATLVGQIVDSKCFLGVMKPGELEPHRACAVRCISGGIPPVLVVRDAEGTATYYLLADEDGRAVNARVLDKIAVPVSVTGELVRHGDLLVLRARPELIALVH
jgi:hypothetical protein